MGPRIGEVDDALIAADVPISIGDLGIAHGLGAVGPLPRIIGSGQERRRSGASKHAAAIARGFKRASLQQN